MSVSSGGYSDYRDFKGDVLKQQYIIIEFLGRGVYASVWLAYDYHNDKFYAIKIQNDDCYYEGLEEVEILKKIKGKKYMCQLIDNFIIERNESHVCMVFNLMAGNLYELMKCPSLKNGYTKEFVLKVIEQIVNGVKELHKMGYIHTDIKPENILLKGVNLKITSVINDFKKLDFMNIYKTLKSEYTEKQLNKKKGLKKKLLKKATNIILEKLEKINDDYIYLDEGSYDSSSDIENTTENIDVIDLKILEDPEIEIIDFGTVKEIKEKKYPEIQTRYYRAPEVILSNRYNEKIDYWSIGCTFYELLVNEILFDPDKDTKYNRDNYHLHDIIKKLGKIDDKIISNYAANDYKDSKKLLKQKNLKLIPKERESIKKLLKQKFTDKVAEELEKKILTLLMERTY